MTTKLNWDGGKLVNPDFFLTGEDGSVSLRGGVCATCNKYFFPYKEICTVCFQKTVKETPLSGRGKLVSWSVASQPSIMGLESPYCFGYIDLEEGVRIYSLLEVKDNNFEVLYKGKELQMTMGFLYQNITGEDIYTYKFTPVETINGGGD